MKTLLLLVLLLSPLAHAQTAPASLNGEWFVQESAGGSDSAKACEFTQKGSDLSGTCTAKATGSVPITGKVDGDKITWTMKFQTMVGPVTATYYGALKAENKITGIVNAQEFKMESEFSATRYKLVWSDEFNQDGKPDPKKWTYETGFVRNRELQWYQPDNARCENGFLIIEARRERKKNPNYVAGSDDWTKNREYAEYTSASLLTRGLATWKYGRFEMRARIDTRPGLWPEFWTLGTKREWPWGGEIDILESWGGLLNANFIWSGQTPGYSRSSSKRRPIALFGDPEGLASELRRSNVRVTVVLPGGVATNIRENSAVNSPHKIVDSRDECRRSIGRGPQGVISFNPSGASVREDGRAHPFARRDRPSEE